MIYAIVIIAAILFLLIMIFKNRHNKAMVWKYIGIGVVLFILIGISIYLPSSIQYGYILDEKTLKPVKNVMVRDLYHPSKITYTNEDGRFHLFNCFDVRIEKDGYKADTLERFGCRPDPDCFDGHIFYMNQK